MKVFMHKWFWLYESSLTRVWFELEKLPPDFMQWHNTFFVLLFTQNLWIDVYRVYIVHRLYICWIFVCFHLWHLENFVRCYLIMGQIQRAPLFLDIEKNRNHLSRSFNFKKKKLITCWLYVYKVIRNSSLVKNYKLPKYFSLHQQSLEQNIHFMHKVNFWWKCEVIAPLLTY